MIGQDDVALHGAARSIKTLSTPRLRELYLSPHHIAPLPPPCHPLILSLLSTPKRIWAPVWCDPGKKKPTRKEEGGTAIETTSDL